MQSRTKSGKRPDNGEVSGNAPLTRKHRPSAEIDEDAEPNGPGSFVRALRVRQGLTLDELALQSGMSKGHLSRFERGEKTVSLATLMRVAQALNTSTASLLGEQVDKNVLHVVRAIDRHYQTEGDYQYAPLNRADSRDGPKAFLLRVSSEADVKEAAFHSGDEFFFVLSGAIEVELADQSIVLREGDFAQFPGIVNHRIRSIGSDAQLLIFVG